MRYLILTFTLCFSLSAWAQTVTPMGNIQPEGDYENVSVKKLTSDARSTSFVIWVKQGVKAHYHEEHSETIYVIEGTAEMTMGDQTFTIKAGDYIHIPKGTVQSVKVTSPTPIKVLSVQAPEFLGKDRIFVNQ
ncbi:MAG: cupin domain-containing protein [Salibacteraceae bacterium]